MKCGGFTNQAKESGDDVQQVVNSVRKEAEQKHNGGQAYAMFKAELHISQVVAGINYKVRVQVAQEDKMGSRLFLKIYKPLPHTGNPPQLTASDDGRGTCCDIAQWNS